MVSWYRFRRRFLGPGFMQVRFPLPSQCDVKVEGREQIICMIES